MITDVHGNLLAADADALVNTVNTVGVMGKGIALQFKNAYPGNYKAYRAACQRHEVRLGEMFVFDAGQLVRPRWVINFPTKNHWKSPSRLTDIESGLDDLVRVITEHDIRSIAVPPLGCGNGGLDWADVRPIIEAKLRGLDVEVLLYPPEGDRYLVGVLAPPKALPRYRRSSNIATWDEGGTHDDGDASDQP